MVLNKGLGLLSVSGGRDRCMLWVQRYVKQLEDVQKMTNGMGDEAPMVGWGRVLEDLKFQLETWRPMKSESFVGGFLAMEGLLKTNIWVTWLAASFGYHWIKVSRNHLSDSYSLGTVVPHHRSRNWAQSSFKIIQQFYKLRDKGWIKLLSTTCWKKFHGNSWL